MNHPISALFSLPCEFIAGASDAASLPLSGCAEVAFVGRANVGKSSLINAITGKRNLARASSTPGRTRQINLFRIKDKLALVDLPGYGYSKASRTEVAQWMRMVQQYLTNRATLKRVFLLIDARRGIMASDEGAMRALDDIAISYQLILTKADALKKTALDAVMEAVQNAIKSHGAAYPQIIATSCRTGDGIGSLRAALAALIAQK